MTDSDIRKAVTVHRVYDVECSLCGGVVAGDKTRPGAERERKLHIQRHQREGSGDDRQ